MKTVENVSITSSGTGTSYTSLTGTTDSCSVAAFHQSILPLFVTILSQKQLFSIQSGPKSFLLVAMQNKD